MNPEIIAKLVGLLEFKVDLSGLTRFNRGLDQTRQKMQALSREADVLSKKLSAKMGLKVDSAGQDKLSRSVRANLDRELKLEQAVQRTRRATFTAELQGQKLINLRQKEGAALQTQALRDKIAQAVLDAKAAKAEGERLKVQGAALKQAQSIEQHKARQARWEALLLQQRKKTAILQQKQLQAMTATQRAELALQQARVRGQRAAEKFAASQHAVKLRAQRLDVSHAQRAERFRWAQTRQAAWAAKQAEPKISTGFMGLGTGALALGGVTAGLAAIVGAVSALGDRLAATQTRVSESQQFSNILEQAAGRNPANKDFAKSEFLRISHKYGTAVDNDSAKDYRTYLLAQMARGKSLSAATADFETTMAAYRGAGLTRDEQRRTSLQYQQVRSKTVADREDLNTFSEAAPLLVEPIRRAWAERNKHALDANLEKDFRASTKTGNLKAIDFENGIKLFVKESAAAIERQNGSIDANTTRLANQKFLQQQGLDQNPELIGAINDRIKAEMELTEAMKPFKATMVQLDIGLANLAASLLRLTAGRNADGSEKSEQQQLQDRMSTHDLAIDSKMVGTGDYSSVNGDTQHQGGPIGKFWNWLFNVPDYREGPANKPMLDWDLVSVAGLKFPPLDLSKLAIEPPNLADGEYRQFRLPPPITAADLIEGVVAQQQRQSTIGIAPAGFNPDGTPSHNFASGVQSVNSNNVTTTNVEVRVDVHAAEPDPDGEKLGEAVGRHVDDKIRGILQTARANQKEIE